MTVPQNTVSNTRLYFDRYWYELHVVCSLKLSTVLRAKTKWKMIVKKIQTQTTGCLVDK